MGEGVQVPVVVPRAASFFSAATEEPAQLYVPVEVIVEVAQVVYSISGELQQKCANLLPWYSE